jgi:hypothetical protein
VIGRIGAIRIARGGLARSLAGSPDGRLAYPIAPDLVRIERMGTGRAIAELRLPKDATVPPRRGTHWQTAMGLAAFDLDPRHDRLVLALTAGEPDEMERGWLATVDGTREVRSSPIGDTEGWRPKRVAFDASGEYVVVTGADWERGYESVHVYDSATLAECSGAALDEPIDAESGVHDILVSDDVVFVVRHYQQHGMLLQRFVIGPDGIASDRRVTSRSNAPAWLALASNGRRLVTVSYDTIVTRDTRSFAIERQTSVPNEEASAHAIIGDLLVLGSGRLLRLETLEHAGVIALDAPIVAVVGERAFVTRRDVETFEVWSET